MLPRRDALPPSRVGAGAAPAPGNLGPASAFAGRPSRRRRVFGAHPEIQVDSGVIDAPAQRRAPSVARGCRGGTRPGGFVRQRTKIKVAHLPEPCSNANELHQQWIKPVRHAALAAVAGLLCLLVLLCGTLAANENWHHWFHGQDDGDLGSCAVCLFASGGLDQTTDEPPPIPSPAAVLLVVPAPFSPFVPVGFRQDFHERGPPALRS